MMQSPSLGAPLSMMPLLMMCALPSSRKEKRFGINSYLARKYILGCEARVHQARSLHVVANHLSTAGGSQNTRIYKPNLVL